MHHSRSDFPQLAFACPKLWDEMRGDERTRFCDVCGLHVHNLSALSADERAALLGNRAGRLCIGYQRRLNGDHVTPENPLTLRDRKNLRQIGTVALAGAALALASGCVADRSTVRSPSLAPVADTLPVPSCAGDHTVILSAFGVMAPEPSAPTPTSPHNRHP